MKSWIVLGIISFILLLCIVYLATTIFKEGFNTPTVTTPTITTNVSLNTTPTPSSIIASAQQNAIYDTSANSGTAYNTDNLDITYHADPMATTQPDDSSAGIGKMWVEISGNLVSIPYSDASNTTLYYQPGTYQFNAASYVPDYGESVFLSKLTNESTTGRVHNIPSTQNGFCAATNGSMIDRDAKCNALDKNVCASTDCCVLLGGEKCVAGDQSGPSVKSNYSDITIINRDYYYYRGNCYGNC
jgi:hypothetical protein